MINLHIPGFTDQQNRLLKHQRPSDEHSESPHSERPDNVAKTDGVSRCSPSQDSLQDVPGDRRGLIIQAEETSGVHSTPDVLL